MYYSGNTYHQQYITLLIISFSKWALCDPVDYNIHGILQARTLELVAFPFSRGSSQPRDRTQVSHIGGRCFTQIQPSECGVAECVCVCVGDGNRVGGGRRERGRTWAQVVVMRAIEPSVSLLTDERMGNCRAVSELIGVLIIRQLRVLITPENEGIIPSW